VEPREGGRLALYLHVAEEAPTIQGFAGILVEALNDAPVEDYEGLPDDLVDRLGLGEVIRMNRRIGIAALLARIRAAAHQGRVSPR
jgi:cysteine desulfuration protein SufE